MKKKLKEPFLRGEELFRKYFSMGRATSTKRLARWALSIGMAKPVKQTKYNKDGLPCMSVWKAMWRWASLKENKDVAYQIFSDHVRLYGWTVDTEYSWDEGSSVEPSDWNRFMVQKIRSAWQYPFQGMFDHFLLKNGWTK